MLYENQFWGLSHLCAGNLYDDLYLECPLIGVLLYIITADAPLVCRGVFDLSFYCL